MFKHSVRKRREIKILPKKFLRGNCFRDLKKGAMRTEDQIQWIVGFRFAQLMFLKKTIGQGHLSERKDIQKITPSARATPCNLHL